MSIAFETLAAHLISRSVELLQQWFPNGRRIGREFCIGDLQGNPGQSLKVNLDSGLWQDYATGQKGRDLIALYAAIHSLGQIDAAKALSGDSLERKVVPLRPTVSDQPEPVHLPPEGVPIDPAKFRHPRHGNAVAVWTYRTAARAPIFIVARYETKEDDGSHGKTFLPWTWDGNRWRSKAHPKPRPIYGLDRLETHAGLVFIVEGEKAADALQRVTQVAAVITWAGGARNPQHADWSPLRGRKCVLWPDADIPGFEAMQIVAAQLIPLGCALQIVDTEGLAEGWDAANAVQEGLAGHRLNDWLRPRLRTVERPAPVATRGVPEQRRGYTLEQEGPPPEDDAAAYQIAAKYGLAYGKGGVHDNMSNVRLLIQGKVESGAWAPIFYDTFTQKTSLETEGQIREWADSDTLVMVDALQKGFGMPKIRKPTVEDAVNLFAYEHRRNSAQEWAGALKWDEVPRVEELFIAGFGAYPNSYIRAVGRCFMVGMVARVLDPGCQVDTLPVLEGPQGSRKSTGLRVLGAGYHVECQENISNKDFYLVLAGKFLVEIAELTSFTHADIRRINAVITCRVDRYRAPYERRAADHPRACVFAATTNQDDWNRDDSGARRFWPVQCGKIDPAWISQHRGQLYAEAVARYRKGELWYDVPNDLAKIEQEKRREEDIIAPILSRYLAKRTRVTLADCLETGLGMERSQRFDRAMQSRVTVLLKRWGYEPKIAPDDNGRTVRSFVLRRDLQIAQELDFSDTPSDDLPP